MRELLTGAVGISEGRCLWLEVKLLQAMPTGGSWSPVTEQRIVVREVEIHRWP